MKMKHLLSIIMTIALIAALAMPATAAKKPAAASRVTDTYVTTTSAATTKAADLNAGQNTKVGELYIDSQGGNKYLVTYRLSVDGYYFGEIQFEAINAGDSSFIYSAGGIVPGKLTVNQSFSTPSIDDVTGVISGGTREYSFIYSSGAAVTDFAAHSVVCKAIVSTHKETVLVGTQTVTGTIGSHSVDGKAVEVREPFGYPDPTIEYKSVWDTAFSASPAWATKLATSGAQFIWGYELSSGLSGAPVPTTNDLTVNGDVFNVDVPINVPTDATNADATLYIVADNGYIAKIGNDIINSAGFNAEAYAALSDSATDDTLDGDALLLDIFPNLTAFDTKPLFVESVVPTGAWKSMIAVGSGFPLSVGDNTVNIAAMNEHMADGNDYRNPAGVIFFIEYSWDVPVYEEQDRYTLTWACETAWGMDTAAGGSNWSQIIKNVLVG